MATILVGFAHRPLPGFDAATATIGSSNIAFGSFCVASRPVSAKDGAPVGGPTLRVCDACVLFAAPGLGAVAEIVPPPPPGRGIEPVTVVAEAWRSASVVRARARGPPRWA
ncbi:hypothetical protein [Pinisolibacter aquiterrae]|uniref:hypothetical protein n=1 Tax=Pinisolibacter aquiterrae TaxID=2815579 RepID=UPI001C3D19E2|nr:hypothetical protein [Pinisolibacter aquiterrae]MBV5263414.1 hypothetical protein [Pinisolibacter aquiterrae]MCC8237509.1 hypothetical protein [Pinisolibacter aquiterrae]